MSIFLRNKLFRLLTVLYDYLNEIKTVDFITESSKIGIESFKSFTVFLLDNFYEMDEPVQDIVFNFLSDRFIPNVRYIERTITSNIPWSITPYLDKILKSEFDNNYYLIFRPQWHFNYSVVVQDLISTLKYYLISIFPTKKTIIDNIFKDEIKIYLFSFPYLEKTNILLHSVIGHEIGHFFHNRWQILPTTNKLLDDQRIRLSKYYGIINNSYPIKPYERTEEGINILHGMYREIISDFFGYQVFGPSMIFALDYLLDMEQNNNVPSKDNNYYPLTQYRIRLLYEYLCLHDDGIKEMLRKKNKCSGYLRSYFNYIENYLKDGKDKSILKLIPEEISIFEDSITQIVNFTKTSISKKYVHPEKISGLFNLLENDITLNEINGEPIEMPDILFAGWIYYKKLNQDYSGKEYIDKYKILIRLLLKSTYNSYIHSEYIKARRS